MLEKGASFGDDAAFMHKATQPRTDTATCETACSLVVLRKAEYHQVSHTTFSVRLYPRLSGGGLQAILEYLEREYRPTTLFLKVEIPAQHTLDLKHGSFVQGSPLAKGAHLNEDECFKLAMAMTQVTVPGGTVLIREVCGVSVLTEGSMWWLG